MVGDAHYVDVTKPEIQIFKNIAREMYGIECEKTQSHGASDARYFGKAGLTTLVVSPNGGNIHSDDEFIDLQDLVRFYNVMKEWIHQIGRADDVNIIGE